MALATEIERFSIVQIDGTLYKGLGLVTHVWEGPVREQMLDNFPKQRPDQPYPQYGIRLPAGEKFLHFNADDLPKLTVVGKARYFSKWNKPSGHGWHLNPDGTWSHNR